MSPIEHIEKLARVASLTARLRRAAAAADIPAAELAKLDTWFAGLNLFPRGNPAPRCQWVVVSAADTKLLFRGPHAWTTKRSAALVFLSAEDAEAEAARHLCAAPAYL